jgi:hypothetical protein
MERSQGEMIASIASLGRPSPAQRLMGRAVAPAADAPTLKDRPRQPAAQPNPRAVALAPAAMSALIEAQAQLNEHAPAPDRQDTAARIDRLIVGMAGTATPAAASFDVRRLQQARSALTQGPATFQA